MIDGPTALYRFFDDDDRLLYVGISARPWARWKRHQGEKVWWRSVASIRLEHHDDRLAALEAERLAIVAERPAHNVIHNGARLEQLTPAPGGVGRWIFRNRRSGYERQTDLHLTPEPNGLAVLCDYYDDELDDDEVIEVYLRWLHRHHRGSFDAIPIYWTVTGDGLIETAPGQDTSEGLGDFLTHFTRPEDVDTGERCSFYRLPLRHRFPRFWSVLAYQPAPLQAHLPLASILRLRDPEARTI